MILKNQYARGIFTGAVAASAVVILSFFEPDRFVLPAVLATVILVFCAPYLTFGRPEGIKAERSYQLAAVVAGVAVGLVVVGQRPAVLSRRLLLRRSRAGQCWQPALWVGRCGRPALIPCRHYRAVLDGKVVWARRLRQAISLFSDTLSVLALGVVLLTVHQLFRVRDESLKVDLNFSQIIGVEVCILLHLMVPVLVS